MIIANNCLLAGYVQVGDGAFIGGGVAFSPIHADRKTRRWFKGRFTKEDFLRF